MHLVNKWSLFLIGCVVLVVVVVIKGQLFHKQLKRETEHFLQGIPEQSSIVIDQDRLDQLPAPVLRWLNVTGALEQQAVSTVQIKQDGLLKTTPDGKWMPFHAEQYAVVDHPAFIWKANIEALPGIMIFGRDLYSNQDANMLIKLMGIFTVADASGPELIQGSLVRYLAESVWYPQAALSQYIHWTAIDDDMAKAEITYGDIRVAGIFYFKESGEPERFIAQRYMENGGTYSLEEWVVEIEQYQAFNEMLIPSKGNVYWNLEDHRFHWLQFEVTDATFITY